VPVLPTLPTRKCCVVYTLRLDLFHGMEEVVGSIPTRSTNSFNNLAGCLQVPCPHFGRNNKLFSRDRIAVFVSPPSVVFFGPLAREESPMGFLCFRVIGELPRCRRRLLRSGSLLSRWPSRIALIAVGTSHLATKWRRGRAT
jgi:hypothetical protein